MWNSKQQQRESNTINQEKHNKTKNTNTQVFQTMMEESTESFFDSELQGVISPSPTHYFAENNATTAMQQQQAALNNNSTNLLSSTLQQHTSSGDVAMIQSLTHLFTQIQLSIDALSDQMHRKFEDMEDRIEFVEDRVCDMDDKLCTFLGVAKTSPTTSMQPSPSPSPPLFNGIISDRKYFCEEHKQQFASSSNYYRHMREVHSKERRKKTAPRKRKRVDTYSPSQVAAMQQAMPSQSVVAQTIPASFMVRPETTQQSVVNFAQASLFPNSNFSMAVSAPPPMQGICESFFFTVSFANVFQIPRPRYYAQVGR